VTRNALHQYWYAAEFGALVMAPDALSALLRLMWEVTARVEIRFVMPVPEYNGAARPSEIESDHSGCRVIRLYLVAIALIALRQTRQLSSRVLPRQQSHRHHDRVQDQSCHLESHPGLISEAAEYAV
jgi:hypothetical protein